MVKTRKIAYRGKQEIIEFLQAQGIEPHSENIHITEKGYYHLSRQSKKELGKTLHKDELLELPKIINEYDVVLFDTETKKLNLIYASKSKLSTNYNKIVVDPRGYDKKFGAKTLVKTAGIVQEHNLKDKRYITIKGSI